MTFDDARDASRTALNWASGSDRAIISENLRTNAEVLAGEILQVRHPRERINLLSDLQRAYTRLAVCDMAAAREAGARMEKDKQRDTLCRITLEKMADMVDDAIGTSDQDEYARMNLTMAMRFAQIVQDERLEAWFPTGPYSGLGRMSATIAQMTLDDGMRLRAGLMEVCAMARRIPLDQGVDEEKIEAQVFRDGLGLLRRHLGLEKESHGM